MTTPHSQLDTPALELPFGAATGHDSAARLGAQIWAIGLAVGARSCGRGVRRHRCTAAPSGQDRLT
jgi:hypothetical protein